MNNTALPLIYIVEDEPDIRELEEYALKSNGYRVVSFASSEPFWDAIEKEYPDLVLLDIMLPVEDGLSILKKLRSTKVTSTLPIIMITAKTSEIDSVRGLDLGADDYISKPFGVMEMLSRVRSVLRRSGTTNDQLQSVYLFENIRLDNNKRQVTVDGSDIELTYKEFEVLMFLMKNPRIVFSRDTLMSSIWGFDYTGESRTVDVHVTTLRKKLGDSGQYIQTVRNVGYKIDN